jgi:hypothetical protein
MPRPTAWAFLFADFSFAGLETKILRTEMVRKSGIGGTAAEIRNGGYARRNSMFRP